LAESILSNLLMQGVLHTKKVRGKD
jgi:hypothetical protein